MKRFFLFFFFCSLTFLFAQDNKDVTAIENILKAQEDAWNAGDLVSFMDGYWKSDSLVFVGRSGPTYGFERTLENYRKGYPNRAAMGKLSFDLLHIKQWDEQSIQLIGAFHLQRENDAPSGYFTLLFRRFDSGWKIVSDHSSSSQ